jgi:hypothetical protein
MTPFRWLMFRNKSQGCEQKVVLWTVVISERFAHKQKNRLEGAK